MWRQQFAVKKFKQVKKVVKAVLREKSKVIVKLGCQSESESYFKELPSVLVENICSYAGLPEPVPMPKPKQAPVIRTRSGRAVKRVNYSELGIDSNGNDRSEKSTDTSARSKHHADSIDLTDFSLYEPGSKIVIPLLKPDTHLTSPCSRDFSRKVRKHKGWNAKRLVATAEEKIEFKETRKADVYFINLIYTVPGEPIKKQRKELKAARALRLADRTGEIEPKRLKRADAFFKQGKERAQRSNLQVFITI